MSHQRATRLNRAPRLKPPFATVLLGCVLLFQGCCRSDGPCSAPSKSGTFYNKLDRLGYFVDSTAVVKTKDETRVTLEDASGSITIRTGDASRIFTIGQSVRVTTCQAAGVGNDPYTIVRDTDQKLLLVSSGGGAGALDTPCTISGLTIDPIDHDCCGIDDDCGDDVPIELRFRGDTEILLSSDRQGTFAYQSARLAVIVAVSTRRGSTNDCSDISPNRVSYLIYRQP